MENRNGTPSQKRSLWDLLKEGSKGLGILFPSEEKKQPRRTSSAQVPNPNVQAASSEPKNGFGKSGQEQAALSNDTVSSNQASWTPRIVEKDEAVSSPETHISAPPVKQEMALILDEEAKRNFRQIQEQLQEIRQIQAELSQNAESTPMAVEKALEKVFYWVQERENKQVDGLVKEMEQRLNSGQLEILMELRTLVNETDKMALAEQKISALEKLADRRLTRLRIVLGMLIFTLGGLAGFGVWFYFEEILKLPLPW